MISKKYPGIRIGIIPIYYPENRRSGEGLQEIDRFPDRRRLAGG